MLNRSLLFLLPVFALLLGGCQSMQLKDQQAQLEETLRTYSGTGRWGELADAYKFLEPELAMQHTPPAGLENLRVTRYEEVDGPVVSGDTAKVTARIRYIQQDRQVVHTMVDKQEWRFSKERGWRRSNPIPMMK
jgi:hypothetical protein